MLNIQLNARTIAIPRHQWLPIGAALALLVSCGVALAYLPETSRAPIGSTEFGGAWAQTFGLLWSGVAAIAALSFLFPAFTRKKITVRHEATGSIVTVGESKFMVLGDGTTYTAGRRLAACQFPDIAFRWQVWSFFRTRPALLPSLLIAVALMSISWLFAATAMPGTNPWAEHGLWLFPMLSKFFVMVLNVMGITLLLVLVLAGLGPSAVGAIAEEVRKQRALPAGEAQALLGGGQDIETMLLPDRYLFQRPSETSEQFADRIVSERAEHGADNYVVIVAPQNDIVLATCPAGTDSPEALQVDESRTYFVPNTPVPFAETPEQYLQFVQAAAKPIKMWLKLRPDQKHGKVEALLVSLARPALRYAATLLFLCFAVTGFGQSKSARLDSYMGNRRPVISSGVEVLFSFSEGTIRRTGDGEKSVQQLLPDGLAFSDADNAGELKEVFINGSKVAPAPRVVASAELGQGSVQPVEIERGYGFLQSTDSTSIERWETAVIVGAKKFGKEVTPRWGFLFFLFTYLFLPLLAGVSLLAYFVAKSAFKEMGNSGNMVFMSKPLVYWGYRARNVVWCCGVVVGLMLLIDGLVTDITAGNSLWEWLLFSAGKMFLLYHLVIWVTPNPPNPPKHSASQSNFPNQTGQRHQLPDGL